VGIDLDPMVVGRIVDAPMVVPAQGDRVREIRGAASGPRPLMVQLGPGERPIAP
jgi:hypothetical protein